MAKIVEDPAREGTYLVNGGVLLEDPDREGTYLILDSSAIYEDPIHPGFFWISVSVDSYLPPELNPTTGHRVESCWVDLLTPEDGFLERLDGVLGGRIELNVNAEISGGGTLNLQDRGQNIAWESCRLQVWVSVTGYVPWPLGVFLPSIPIAQHSESGITWNVSLLDKLSVLVDDKVDVTFSLDVGTNVVQAVRDLIASAGETNTAITDSDEELTSPLVWAAGTTKLRIINDLLGAINYFSIRADGYGTLVAAPYVRPQDRPTAWDFSEGPRAIHLPAFGREQDLNSVPNKVILVSVATYDVPSLVSVATNTDPDSRFSYAARGNRWITIVEQQVEATSQEVLDGLAARRLVALSSPAAALTIQHVKIPVQLNDAAQFHTGDIGPVTGVVQKLTIPLRAGELVTTKVLEVLP